MTLSEQQRIELAWIYLRHVVEGSRRDVLDLLWPDGWELRRMNQTPGDAIRVAGMILRRDKALPESLLNATAHRYDFDPRATQERSKRMGMRLLASDSEDWPTEFTDAFVRMMGTGADKDAGVRGQAEAPFAVWVRGEASLAELVKHSITMVGTRAATRYGRAVAYQFSTELSMQGYTMVSGGADGIDKQAHMAALEGGTRTVAVMACGADVSYPAKNHELFTRMVNSGSLIVSEYAPGTSAARHRFLTRNRLAAALGKGTVMVEAPVRSGAINTMNWAESMLKPTLAVPGPVDTAASQGTLLRIQEGRAQMAITSQDILDAVEPLGRQLELDVCTSEGSENNRGEGRGAEGGFDQRGTGPKLSWQETAVFDAAGIENDDSGSLTEIQRDTGLDGVLVMKLVRDLEAGGLLRRMGDRWVKVRD